MCSGFNIILHYTALNSFLDELDKRVDECQKKPTKHVPERRNRRLGNYIDSRPPVGAPRWTVSNDWLEGMYPNCYKTVTIMFYAYRASRV